MVDKPGQARRNAGFYINLIWANVLICAGNTNQDEDSRDPYKKGRDEDQVL